MSSSKGIWQDCVEDKQKKVNIEESKNDFSLVYFSHGSYLRNLVNLTRGLLSTLHFIEIKVLLHQDHITLLAKVQHQIKDLELWTGRDKFHHVM